MQRVNLLYSSASQQRKDLFRKLKRDSNELLEHGSAQMQPGAKHPLSGKADKVTALTAALLLTLNTAGYASNKQNTPGITSNNKSVQSHQVAGKKKESTKAPQVAGKKEKSAQTQQVAKEDNEQFNDLAIVIDDPQQVASKENERAQAPQQVADKEESAQTPQQVADKEESENKKFYAMEFAMSAMLIAVYAFLFCLEQIRKRMAQRNKMLEDNANKGGDKE